jgi:glycosyltransferase involved in cell wall biosynthesis
MLRRRARELITGSCVRLAFGEKMRQAYQQRYGVAFEATYHLDDPRRFSVHESGGDGSGTTILYVGGLGHRRYEAIEDLTAAVQELSGQLGQIRIKVLCRGIPKEMPRGLLCSAEVDFGPLPSHDELPKVLVGATVLFLPESFTESPAAIEYSLSTKAHLYMSSGRPVLVYGPAYSGTVDYALREGWGVVVAERNVTKLKEALAEMIIGGGGKECNLRRNAQMCLINHHDVAVGQERFRILLSKCVCC